MRSGRVADRALPLVAELDPIQNVPMRPRTATASDSEPRRWRAGYFSIQVLSNNTLDAAVRVGPCTFGE